MLKFEVFSFKDAPRPLKKPRKNNIERTITKLLKKKKLKKLHNAHTATGNLNPKLCIRTYNGSAVIIHLRKLNVKKRQKIT